MGQVNTIYIQSPVLVFVSDTDSMRPYYSPSEIQGFHLEHPRFVSLDADYRLMAWAVEKDTILVTRSGSVGQQAWVDTFFDGALVSGDAIRVRIENKVDRNLVYVLLKSSLTDEYLNCSKYGSVVEHISVDQLKAFPILQVPEKLKEEISSKIEDSRECYGLSRKLLTEAVQLVIQTNNLSLLNQVNTRNVDPEYQVEVVMVTIPDIGDTNNGEAEYRLDANYYNTMAQLAIKNLKTCGVGVKTVQELSERVILGPRFKRTYVDSAFGTPFLSGKNISQIRPTDLKYLSNSETPNLAELLVERDWILVTCSGTIGRTCFVWHNYEKYAASQHILRIVPNSEKIDPGYLFAFLSSPYGYEQICRFRHGSVIDEITDKQIEKVLVPCPSRTEQETVGDMVRLAYEKRADAIRLEDEAQVILVNELTKGVGVR